MSRQKEAVMSDEVLLILQGIGPHVRFWTRTNGVFRTMSGAVVKVGIPGAADLHGFVQSQPAMPVEVELKWGKNGLDEAQVKWRDLCIRLGVPWFLCHAKEATIESFRAAGRATAQEIQEFIHAARR